MFAKFKRENHLNSSQQKCDLILFLEKYKKITEKQRREIFASNISIILRIKLSHFSFQHIQFERTNNNQNENCNVTLRAVVSHLPEPLKKIKIKPNINRRMAKMLTEKRCCTVKSVIENR